MNTINLQKQIIELKLKLQLRDTDIRHLENDLKIYKQGNKEKEDLIKELKHEK